MNEDIPAPVVVTQAGVRLSQERIDEANHRTGHDDDERFLSFARDFTWEATAAIEQLKDDAVAANNTIRSLEDDVSNLQLELEQVKNLCEQQKQTIWRMREVRP